MKVSDIMQKNVLSVPEDTLVSKAISLMEQHGFKELPVTKDNELIGKISFYDIMDKVKIQPKEKVSNLMSQAPTISPDEDLEGAARLMKESGTEFLIVGGKNIEGVLSDYDILKNMKGFFKGIPVSRIVRRGVPLLPADSSISKAKNLMERKRVDRLPVVDKSRYLGQVTWADVVRSMANIQRPGRMIGEKIDSTKKPVSDIIRPGEKVFIDSEVDKAINLMLKKQIGGIPVVNMDNGVEGVLFRRDLLNLLVQEEERIDVEIAGKLGDEEKLLMMDEVARKLKKFKDVAKVKIRVKEIHGGSKHEISLFIPMRGKNISMRKDGFLKPTFDDLLSDAQRILST